MDPYTILGVSRHCSDSELKKAYHNLVLQYHPDRAGPQNTERCQQINDAYERILKGRRTGVKTRVDTSWSAPTNKQGTETSEKFNRTEFDWTEFDRTEFDRAECDGMESDRADFDRTETESDEMDQKLKDLIRRVKAMQSTSARTKRHTEWVKGDLDDRNRMLKERLERSEKLYGSKGCVCAGWNGVHEALLSIWAQSNELE